MPTPEIVIDADGLLARARVMPKCEKCGDHGYTIIHDNKGRSKAISCSCWALRNKARLFNYAQIPSNYWDATYNNFNNQDLPHIVSAIKKAKESVAKYNPSKLNKGLLLFGNTGTGKTRLLSAIARDFTINKGIKTRFIEFTQLLHRIKRGYDLGESEAEFLLPLIEIDILLIDELGKGRKSEWEASILDQIVAKRYFARKTIYFTSNYLHTNNMFDNSNSDDNAENISLRKRIEPRIFSRLLEMTDFVNMCGPDYRKDSTNRMEMTNDYTPKDPFFKNA